MSLRNHYQLLVADIDGTLLNGRGTISTEDKEAVAAARNAGIRVSLSSGRAMRACLNVLEELSLDSYHMFFDGALVSSPSSGEEVYARPLGEPLVKFMVESAHRLGMDLELYSPTRYFAERETWSTGAHRDFFEVIPDIVSLDGIWKRERIIKGLAAITNPEEEATVGKFRQLMGDRLHFSEARTPAYPGVTFVNIVAPDTSKGKAMEALAAYLDVPKENIMAIGDGTNDISLLSAVGLGVAMGNASAEVKASARCVTGDVEHSGLAAAIKKFLL